MKPRPLIIAGLLLISLLAGMTATDAALSGPTTTSTSTNVGNFIQAQSRDSMVVVVHKSDTGNLAVDVSSNGGATFTTKPVNSTSSAFAANVAISGNCAFAVVFETGTGEGNIETERTTDCGDTWSKTSFNVGGGAGAVDNQRPPIATAYFSTRLFMAAITCPNGSCNSASAWTVRVYYSDNSGQSWTAAHPGAAGSNNANVFGTDLGVGILPTSTTAWEVFWTSPDTSNIRTTSTTNSGVAYATQSTVNDGLSPLSSYGESVHVAWQRSPPLIASRLITAGLGGGTIYAAERAAVGTSYTFTSLGESTNSTVPLKMRGCGNSTALIYQGNVWTGDRGRYAYRNGSWAPANITDLNSTGLNVSLDAVQVGTNQIFFVKDSSTGRVQAWNRTVPTSDTCPLQLDTFASSAQVIVPGLQAFKVDTTGQGVLIARKDAGVNVSTYSPGTLGLLGTDASGCASTVSGIDAMPTHVAYTVCSPATDTDEIRIRSPTLGSPNLNGCTWCQTTLSETDFNLNLPNSIQDLETISEYPYTFTNQNCGITPGNCATVVAFPFTEIATGDFGIYAVRMLNKDVDSDTTTRYDFGPGGTTITDICSWRSPVNGRDYIAVAEPSVGLRVFTFTIDASGGLDGLLGSGDIVISSYQSAPSFLLTAGGVSCAGNLIMGYTTGASKVVGAYWLDSDGTHVAGQTAWGPITYGAATASGGHPFGSRIALSPGQEFAIYLDDATVRLVNATTGVVRGNITTLNGTAPTLLGLDMDRAANNVWVGWDPVLATPNDERIERFSVFTITTGNETLDSNNDPFDTGPGSATGGASSSTSTSFGPAGGVISPGVSVPTGWTTAAFNAFLGIILMFSIAGGCWFFFGKHPLSLVIGALAGFILALVFQLFSLWVLIVVVILGVVIIFLRVKSSAGATA